MSSEMKEFEDLSKDAVKDWSDHTNDARSEIAELRAKNTELKNQIAQAQNGVSDSPAKKVLTVQQEPQSALPNQEHQKEVKKVASSTQMCLGGGINDLMNPDYFTDFLITAGEPLDKQRPSYTDYVTRLQKWDTWNQWKSFQEYVKGVTTCEPSHEAPTKAEDMGGYSIQKQWWAQPNSPESIAKARSKAAELIGSVSLVGQNESTVDWWKLQKDAWVAPGTQQYNILTANAMRWSGGIQDSWPVSTWFQNVPLSRPNTGPVSDIKPKPANRIANN